MSHPAHWIAVASAGHVARGRADGFMQVCHGKSGPLRRTAPGDGVVYYSPTETYRGQDRLQAFTAIGRIRDMPVYTCDMGGGFIPHRRDVDWWPADPAPIRPLLGDLDLTRGQRNWGGAFRFGLVRITAADFARIATAMHARPVDA